ncbi:hypothetical protein O1611_g5823 [Lasiodiplodia mahajangana]|uniref:Uncharacterized protein n=1 Tax=Lasiodiplodia mahajangana TaxID=1108764 RepID=A0ACC2JKK3_9PEZI|nr:hypothetical protein O1611_g5823 [Lasiodiplodia mahajangana]
MSLQSSSSYQPLPSGESVDGSSADEAIVVPSKLCRSARNSNWAVFFLFFLLLITNSLWAWRTSHPSSREAQLSPVEPDRDDSFDVREENYPPVRRILQPIYQDTEFNEEGENKERANGLWKGLFPNGNGVISLNKPEAQAHGLHDTADDPRTEGNSLYIIAGFHTMHCVVCAGPSMALPITQSPLDLLYTDSFHLIDRPSYFAVALPSRSQPDGPMESPRPLLRHDQADAHVQHGHDVDVAARPGYVC